ncbi:MAG: YggU family protein [Desulfotalea sp.]|nr:MAG: YggU family protein [Desulfotalea sp.]
MPYLTTASDGRQLLFLHVQPKGSKTRIVGLHDQRLKIAVSSPPVDGKANKEVVRFLASVIGVGKKDIVIKAGLQSRKKTVLVSSVSAAALREIIQSFI